MALRPAAWHASSAPGAAKPATVNPHWRISSSTAGSLGAQFQAIMGKKLVSAAGWAATRWRELQQSRQSARETEESLMGAGQRRGASSQAPHAGMEPELTKVTDATEERGALRVPSSDRNDLNLNHRAAVVLGRRPASA